MTELELIRRFPQASAIPHVELGDLPTPVESLDELGAEVGIDQLWVKRDDLTSSLYGGNKVRKLEFLLGHAKAEGRRQVWTVGAIGSHHVLATSLFARELDIEPRALHFPQPLTDHVCEVLQALSTTRPDLELVDSKNVLPVKLAQRRVRDWLSRSKDPYYIPGGGSSPRGVLGYINAAFELARQIDDGELPEPEVIFVAAGTCGTLAGLTLGAKMAELSCEVIGVRVVDKVLANSLVTANLANRAGRLLAEFDIEVPRIRARDVTLLDEQFGPGYGEETPEGLAAIELALRYAPFELDPTYTAKAFAGLLAHCRDSSPPPSRVLYWHTLSSADLGELVEGADIEGDLPEKYQKFFDGRE